MIEESLQICTSIHIAHEMPGRIRLVCRMLNDPSLDISYLEAMISTTPGVEKARINLRGNSIIVWYNNDPSVREKVLSLLESPPEDVFQAKPARDLKADATDTVVKILMAVLTGGIPRKVAAPLSITMSAPVIADGLQTLMNEGLRVPVLDGAAVGMSLLRRDFFTANAIVAMLSLGEYLEKASEAKTTDLLKNLLRPQVETLWVERDGKEIRIPPEAVMIGDRVICGPGELIPVDGTVAEGEASLNQSSITGESLPVHVQPDSAVLSGGVVVEGRIIIRAQTVGAETGMARIRRFLENALKSKSRSQKQSDELADKLAPITFALAIGNWLISRDIRKAASILTVDYSCAIKVATPVAVRVGMYTAAHNGVLIKGAAAMDALSRVDTVVFDKTGTLTLGNLCITDIVPFNGASPEELLALAAGAEEHYAHPVAHAVVAEARRRNISLPEVGQVDFIVAHGVSAYVNEKRVLVGSRHFIHEDENVDCSNADLEALSLCREGKSLLYVACEGELIGMIALVDELRPEAPVLLQKLKSVGIQKTVMLTGDNKETAQAISAQLGALDEVYWDLKPEEKADIVKDLQSQGRFVAFVGDGVNDAPALLSADVGVSMPDGAELAKESARIILLEENIGMLFTAIRIAAKTQKTIKNCFYSSVGLNSLIMMLAGMGRLSPAVSAIFHNATTLGVISYAALAGLEGKTQPGGGSISA